MNGCRVSAFPSTWLGLGLLWGMGLVLCPSLAIPYPLDGYARTGIRRLEGARLVQEGQMKGRKQPLGARLPTAQVDLRLLDYPDLRLPKPDPTFTAQVVGLLGDHATRYGVSVLDLSNPAQPRYAEHRGDVKQNVGSVGKIIVALGLLQALADRDPDDLQARQHLLRETLISADAFIKRDHHKVRLWQLDPPRLTRRPLREGDRGSLWEYLDWTLSASSNAAAAMVMQHTMLLAHFGRAYPVAQAEAERFFSDTSKRELGALFAQAFFAPLERNGFDLTQIRQGSFFTREGKRRVPSTSSYATSRTLMQLLLRMEQGKLVDVFSSRELKRLLYMTERRIRYASSPALTPAAVYFKSGSLYSCKAEAGFVCKKYQGNVKNYMNSAAIVESPAGAQRHFYYLTTLLSNVLRQNAAVDHQTLATRIHRLIEQANPPKVSPAASGRPNRPTAR